MSELELFELKLKMLIDFKDKLAKGVRTKDDSMIENAIGIAYAMVKFLDVDEQALFELIDEVYDEVDVEEL